MKHIIKYLTLSVLFLVFITACDKKDSITYSPKGQAPVLSSSNNNIAPQAKDSSSNVLVLNWTNPQYSTKDVNYILQLDTSANFTTPVSYTLSNVLNDSFTAGQLNNILVYNYILRFNVAANIYIKVNSSYANNNEAYTSNVLNIKVTPYIPGPPIVTPPTDLVLNPADAGSVTGTGLFITGGSFGWGNPAAVPGQQFTQIDSVTYSGVFALQGGQQFLLLPFNGSWNYKYAVIDNTIPAIANGLGGSFGFYSSYNNTSFNSNMIEPPTAGNYKIVVDFERGIYTITPQ